MSSWFPSTTYLILGLVLGIIALGFIMTCAVGVMKGMLRLLGLSSWAMSWLWYRLTGKTPDSHGSSHWADEGEITRQGLFTPGGITLATWQGKTLYEPSGAHIAIVAPPRSWKSTAFLAPNIATFAGSVLVNDPRAELWSSTHTAREALGACYRFNPTGKDSCGIDITDAIRWGHDEQHGDVARLSHQLLSPDPGESWDDFSLQASALLAPILTHGHDRGHGSLPGIYQWLTDPTTTMKEQAAEMSASAIPQVQAGGRRLKDLLTSERTASIVWNRLISALDLYSDPLVAANCDHSDMDLRDLQHAPRPVSLFLTPSFSDVPRLRPLLGALTDQLCALFSAQQETPPNRVALFLDETGNLGRLDGIERGQSFLQGCGVQIIQVWQNVLQCRQVYGKDSPILASVGTRIYYTPADQETAEDLSEQCGVRTAQLRPESHTRTVWGLLTSTTTGTTEHERRLRTADECRRLPETAAVIIHKGLAPIMGRKLGSAAPEVIDLSKPVVKRVALAAAACLVAGLVTTWAIWPKPPAPAPALHLTSETASPAPGMTTDLTTEPERLARWFEGPAPITSAPPLTQPWRLMVTQGSIGEKLSLTREASLGQGWIQSRFTAEANCQESLQGQVERKLSVARQQAATGTKGQFVTVQHQHPGSIAWEVGSQMGTRASGSTYHVFCVQVVEAE